MLINFSMSIVPDDWVSHITVNRSLIKTRQNLPRRIKGWLFGTARVSEQNFLKFSTYVTQTDASVPLVLMVGAGQTGMGSDCLYDHPHITVFGFDIYPSDKTLFCADAHDIPLDDACVDGVCIQAVLEHVLDPCRVVAEIYRVLKPGGIVYAETPFMQQVHEGAYDFTRFSELGHRWLFRKFESIDRGVIGGPGLSVYWSVKYLFRGLTQNRTVANILSLPFGVLALLDRFMPKSQLIDGANGVYFLGRKGETDFDLKQISTEYLGAQ